MHLRLGLIPRRVNSLKHAKILLPSSATMKRLAPILRRLRKKANIRRFLQQYLPTGAPFMFIHLSL